MKRLRILVDAHVVDGMFQGSRTYIEQLYREAVRFGQDDIEFFFAALHAERLQPILGDHPHVHYLSLRSGNRYSRLGIDYPRLISRHRIDWAHFQYFGPPIKRCRYLLTIHDILFEQYPAFFPLSYRLPKHWLFRAMARSADLLTTVSAFSRQALRDCYGIPLDRIHVITNGVAPANVGGPLPSNPPAIGTWDWQSPYLLYLSRLEPRKNHLGLLEAVLDLGLLEQGFDLIFAGTRSIPDHAFDLRLRAIPSRLRNRIHFFDTVSEAEKHQLIARARAFIYPSLGEGFGIPPLEAAMALTPVVCSNLTAMADFEFFKPYHIDPLKPGALREAISSVLREDDPARLRQLAAIVQARFSWTESARQLVTLLLAQER